MTVVVAQVEIIIEVVDVLVPDQGRLMMTDIIDPVAEVVEMTMIEYESAAHAVNGTEVESELQVLKRRKANLLLLNLPRMSETGVLSLSNNLRQD